MAIKFDTFKTSTAGASDVTSVNGEQGDVIVTLDSATDQGATTSNSITVGGLSVGTAYSLPTADGTANQSLVTDGSGNLSFTTLDPTGGLEYKGTFNATAGTPSLANAEQGDYYKVDTAGTIYGQTWAVNDSLLINADMGGIITNSKIDKLDNTESVTSVNGQTGPVNLGAGDLSDVTITSAASGEVLKYNGTAWVDASVDYTELTNTPTNVSSFANDANYVASGDNVSVLTNDANYVASGDNVSVLTNDAGYLTDITSENLGDLSDVTVTTPSNGQVLSYNGTNWVNSASSAGSLSGLSDTTIGTPTNGEVLKYNGTAWVDAQLAYSELSGTPTNVSTFTNDANYVASGDNVSTLTNDAGYLTGITGESIGSLSDVTVTSATSGEVLKYNGSAWVDASVDYTEITNTPTNVSTFTNDSGYLTGITGESIGSLSDVTVTSVASGEVLKYNGTAWINDTISAGGGYTFSAISSATTAQISYHYSCDTSGGAFTLTLPALSGVTAGQEIRVKLATAGNDLTIARTGSDTIDGLTSFTLSTAKSSITLVANTSGTDWEIV